MEEDLGSIVYFYLVRGESAKKHRLGAWRLAEQTVDMGEEKIGFCGVPEFYLRNKGWDGEKLRGILQQRLETSGADGYYAQPELCSMLEIGEKLPPLFLVKKLLCQNSCWENLIYIGCGTSIDSPYEEERKEEQLFSVLETYMARINHFTIITARPDRYMEYMDYMYGEYGIPAVCGEQLETQAYKEKKTAVLDGRRSYKPKLSRLPPNASYIDLWSMGEKRYAIETKRRDVNYLGTVKFLDTILKNGYNTIVNRTC